MLRDQPFALQGSLAEAAGRTYTHGPGRAWKTPQVRCVRKGLVWSLFSKCTGSLQAILGVGVPPTVCWGTLGVPQVARCLGVKWAS